jgi:hypothetical protein
MDARAHRGLVAVGDWIGIRDKEFAALLGRDGAADIVRQELIVFCLREFGYRRRWSIRRYQEHCAHLASASTIRNDIYALVGRRLFRVGALPEDRRVALICPTFRLVTWASETIPRLEQSVRRLLADQNSTP